MDDIGRASVRANPRPLKTEVFALFSVVFNKKGVILEREDNTFLFYEHSRHWSRNSE